MTSVYNSSYSFMFTLSAIMDIRLRYVVLFLSLCIYLLIILLNLTLIVIILFDKSLHAPMYLFICNLCFNGLYGTTGFYPKFMYDLLSSSNIISYNGCLLQLFIIYTSIMCEFSTLVVMAYDRYIAICRPLEYHSIIDSKMVAKSVLYSWTFPFIIALPNFILLIRLPLCGSHIDKLYCDNLSIVKLSCVPGTANNVYGFVVICIFVAHAVIVFVSYQRLIVASMHCDVTRKKCIRTCGPHLLSLMNFTLAALFDLLFGRYGSNEFPENLRNFFQVEVLAFPPLLNPLMYGLKLSEVRRRLLKCKRHKKEWRKKVSI